MESWKIGMLKKENDGQKGFIDSPILRFSILKLLDGSRQALSNRENSVQLGDD